MVQQGNLVDWLRLSTIDLLVKIVCAEKNNFSSKAADLNKEGNRIDLSPQFGFLGYILRLHLSSRYLTNIHLANRYMTNRHLANRYLAKRHLTNRHLTERHLAS
jgi:hypothetical protein